MKTKLKYIIGVAALVLATVCVQAQTTLATNQPAISTNGVVEIGQGIFDIGESIYDAVPTNNDVFAYGTYVLKAGKFGIGAGDAYNISQGIGIIGGVDYIGGNFSDVNGGIKIKKTFTWNNVHLTVFGVSALLTPLEGGGSADGGLGTANSAGLDLVVYKQFDIGGCYGTRTGAGSYGGGYCNAYLSWRF